MEKKLIFKIYLIRGTFTILAPILSIILVKQRILDSFEEWGIYEFTFFLLLVAVISIIPTIFFTSKIRDLYLSIVKIKNKFSIEGKEENKIRKLVNVSSLFDEIETLNKMIEVLQFENRILYDTALAIHNTESLEELLDIILARLVTHTNADFGLIFLLDNKSITLEAYSNIAKEDIEKKNYKIGEGLVGWSVHKGTGILTEDVKENSHYIHCIKETRAQITIPVKIYEKTLGVLVLGSYMPSRFKESDFKLIETISGEIGLAINNAKLTENLKRENRNNQMLFELTKEITSSVDLNKVAKIGVRTLTDAIQAKSCIIAVVDEVEDELKIIASQGSFKERMQFLELKGTIEDAFVEKCPVNIKTDSGYIYSIPLLFEEKCLGILHICVERVLTNDEMEFIKSTITPLSSALENASLYKNAENLAIKDGLTGMYNHRYFQEVLDEHVEKSKKYNSNLSLVMLDIDNFKKYNDNFGHPVGDLLLKKVANVMKNNLREQDIISRYGGDEFSIILPNTDAEEARILMEKIRDAISNYDFEIDEENEQVEEKIIDVEEKKGNMFHKELKTWFVEKVGFNKFKSISKLFNITISVGVSSIIDTNYNKDTLIKKADEASLESKRKGKNRVSVWIPKEV